MKVNEPPVVVEQLFGCDAKAVWRAITEVDQMRQWFFDNIPDFKPVVGFKTMFTITNDGREFPHQWEITEVVPTKLVRYNWRYDNYPGDSYVTFELFPRGASTLLKVTSTVTEDYPDDIPEFRRESCVAGWEYFIRQRLVEYLRSMAAQG